MSQQSTENLVQQNKQNGTKIQKKTRTKPSRNSNQIPSLQRYIKLAGKNIQYGGFVFCLKKSTLLCLEELILNLGNRIVKGAILCCNTDKAKTVSFKHLLLSFQLLTQDEKITSSTKSLVEKITLQGQRLRKKDAKDKQVGKSKSKDKSRKMNHDDTKDNSDGDDGSENDDDDNSENDDDDNSDNESDIDDEENEKDQDKEDENKENENENENDEKENENENEKDQDKEEDKENEKEKTNDKVIHLKKNKNNSISLYWVPIQRINRRFFESKMTSDNGEKLKLSKATSITLILLLERILKNLIFEAQKETVSKKTPDQVQKYSKFTISLNIIAQLFEKNKAIEDHFRCISYREIVETVAQNEIDENELLTKQKVKKQKDNERSEKRKKLNEKKRKNNEQVLKEEELKEERNENKKEEEKTKKEKKEKPKDKDGGMKKQRQDTIAELINFINEPNSKSDISKQNFKKK